MSATQITCMGFDISAPSAPVIAAGSGSGSLLGGNYSYQVTFVTIFGESLPSAASNVTTTTTGSMSVSSIAVDASGNASARKLYRTTSGGTSYLLLATIAGNVTTTYTDTTADGSLGAAAPTQNTASSREIAKGIFVCSQPQAVAVASGLTANAGATQATGTLLTGEVNIVATVAAAGNSLLLPALNANNIGLTMTVRNNGANSTNVFPAVGQTINALAANTAIAVASAATLNFVGVSASNWQTY